MLTMEAIKKHKIKILIGIAVIAAILFSVGFLSLAGGLDKSAGHLNHEGETPYGAGNYLYSTVTFTGSGLGQEVIVPVKEIEELAFDKKLGVGYENKYSLLTSGSIFSTRTFTGVNLYKLLLHLGLDPNLDSNTNVTVISSDGYTVGLTLKDLTEGNYNRYDGISETKPSEENLPVLLSFGSDGVPLVGPTGVQAMDKKFDAKEGYEEKADNVGGPIRLTIGQKESHDYNAPQNAKWVTRIIIGNPIKPTIHKGAIKNENALSVTVHQAKSSGQSANANKKEFSLQQIESYGATSQNNLVRGYYGGKHYFEGVDLWRFLRNAVGLPSTNGNVKFTYTDGATETLDLDYLRNISGDYDGYTTNKGGLTISGVKPGLGYSIDGTATRDGKLYGLLPANGTVKKGTTAKEIQSIDVYLGSNWDGGANPNKSTAIEIGGAGMKQKTSVSVGYLEGQMDIITAVKTYGGVSLVKLLDGLGLTVDASSVVVTGENSQVELSLKTLRASETPTILATRISDRPITDQTGPVALRGVKNLNGVLSITVKAKPGLWTHVKAPYDRYLDNTLKITGSQARATKTYTLKQLESLGSAYTLKDHFAAGGGGASYQGVLLRKLVLDNLKNGLNAPTKITIIGKDGYEVALSVEDVMSGVESNYQPGQTRDIILAYSINGAPMVPGKGSDGYQGDNAFGPLRLVVENQTAKWVKSVAEIRLGN